MNPLAQVLHVARKDLRESRWPFVVYFGLVVLATANAMSTSPIGSIVATPMFFVVISGVILVALLIQSDSPVRDDAFWATHPLHPFAVLAAKVLLAVVVIIGVPLIGQAFALSANDVHGTELLRLLPSSALSYSFWLLLAVVIAAITPDLKTFVVVLVSIPLVVAAGLTLLSSRAEVDVVFFPRVIAARIISWLGLLSCIALVIRLYASRFVGRVSRFATAPIATSLVFWAAGVSVSTAPDWVHVNAPTMPVSVSIRDADRRPLAANGSLEIDVAVPSIPAGQRLTLVASDVVLELKDGTNLRLHVGFPAIDFGWARPDLPGIAWRTPNWDSLPVARVPLNLDFTQRQAIQQGVAHVRLNGTLVASTPRVAGNLRLVSGASSVSRGQRLRIESWQFGSGAGSLTLHTWSIRLHDAPPEAFGLATAVRYALVNDNHHDALSLTNSGSGGSSSWLVLPGADVEAWTRSLETRANFPGATPDAILSDDWFGGAHLVVFDWVPVARYAVNAESAVQ